MKIKTKELTEFDDGLVGKWLLLTTPEDDGIDFFIKVVQNTTYRWRSSTLDQEFYYEIKVKEDTVPALRGHYISRPESASLEDFMCLAIKTKMSNFFRSGLFPMFMYKFYEIEEGLEAMLSISKLGE